LRPSAATNLARPSGENDPVRADIGDLTDDVGVKHELDRAQLDGNLGLPVVVADCVNQLGTGHAGNDARDVHQRLDMIDWRADRERVLELHQRLGGRRWKDHR
jgi:hypothetical protein